MDSATITAIFTGLTGLIAAMAAFVASRSRRITEERRDLRRRVRHLERQVLALAEHTFTLELEIARRGGQVPDRPIILEQLNADSDESPPDPPPRGRHAFREEE